MQGSRSRADQRFGDWLVNRSFDHRLRCPYLMLNEPVSIHLPTWMIDPLEYAVHISPEC